MLAVVGKALRGIIGLALVVGLLWCSFNVELGELTFAQHMDRIGQTREAEELLDGSRETVRPVLREATDRMLGEYIEAPTTEHDASPEEEPVPEGAAPPLPSRARKLPSGQ
jgi:hypothetical protein